jgi:hypothetical protein
MMALQSQPPVTDRRVAPRHSIPSDQKLQCKVFFDDHPHPAPIRDLSLGGLQLVLPCPVEAGALATLETFDPATGCLRLRLIRVAYARPQDDGTWLVGSTFLRTLTESEFAELVADRESA